MEEDGYVTLALVLEGDAAIPVTVSVNTLDLQNTSVGDAATGELLEFACFITISKKSPVFFCSWLCGTDIRINVRAYVHRYPHPSL